MPRNSSSNPLFLLPGFGVAVGKGRRVFKMPKVLCLYTEQDCALTIQSLEEFVTAVEARPSLITLDLSDVEKITASAAVLLFANVSYLQIASGYPAIVKILNPRDVDTKKIIYSSGLASALKMGSDKRLENLIIEGGHFSSSSTPDRHYDRTCNFIRAQRADAKNSSFKAINEAILNVGHHAYFDFDRENFKASVGRRFWQYIYVSRDRTMNYIIYDRGRGIPAGFQQTPIIGIASDPKSGHPSNLLDHDWIEYSMMDYKSRTLDQGRGNGSIGMKEPVDLTAVGADSEALPMRTNGITSMFIISGSGCYIHYGSNTPDTKRSIGTALVGTLGEWAIAI